MGVIGVGLMGKVHSTNLATRIPHAQLVAIADANQPLGQKVAAELGVSAVDSDYRQLLKNESIEAVVIATPRREARAGRRRARIGQERLLREAALRHPGGRRRHSEGREDGGDRLPDGLPEAVRPQPHAAKGRVESGRLGRILLMTSKTRDPPGSIASWEDDPKLSGGIFNDTCSHDFDIIRWISGAEFRSVFAVGRATLMPNRKAHGNYDTIVVSFGLSSDAIGHVDSCGTPSTATTHAYRSSAPRRTRSPR